MSSDIVKECWVYFGFKLPSEIILMHIDKLVSEFSNVVETVK